jgi:CRISPR-associated endonuclease/helicase Cas3
MAILSLRAQTLWGKSTEDGLGYPLVCHMLDVAAVAWEILDREPPSSTEQYSRDLGVDAARECVCALIALHDLGKASPAFQSKWESGGERVRQHGLTWTARVGSASHGIVTEACLPDLLCSRGWARKASSNVASAIGAHHGFRATGTDIGAVRFDSLGAEGWSEVRNELVDATFSVLGMDETPTTDSLDGAAYMRLAGLTSFADWIGSDTRHFGPTGDAARIDEHFADSRDRARFALDRIGWTRRAPLKPRSVPFTDMFPFSPRPLQSVTADLVENVDTPSLTLIEAPTGEGKTEAALFAYVQLQRAVGHRGLYVALPTMATGNAMFERVCAFLEACDREQPPDLQLLHGASFLNEAFTELRIRDVWDDSTGAVDRNANVVAREWFTHKKRALLSEYGVGTVDQALFSILNLKHQFVRLWGLSNRVVILDEIHAYDTYTSGLLDILLRWLHALGSSAIVMSATLPPARRRELLATYGATDTPPYPHVTVVTPQRTATRSFEAREMPEYSLRSAPTDAQDLARSLATAVESGGCLACIVNTVQRAQDVYRALGDGKRIENGGVVCGKHVEGVDVYLFHARYPVEERHARENTILRLFGKESEDRPRRSVLIATQVVEQSLDLDFDVMYSDLAPIDLLLQRAGRLHRHERSRPCAHATPMLHISGLDAVGELPDLSEHAWDYVYESYVLFRSWYSLQGVETLRPAHDAQELIERVYDAEDEPDGLSSTAREVWRGVRQEMLDRNATEQRQSRAAGLDDPARYLRSAADPVHLSDEDDPDFPPILRARTRLGDPSITVVPLHEIGEGVYADTTATHEVDLAQTPTASQALRLHLQTVSLSRKGVYHALTEQDAPEAWEDSPLLRHCRPLLLHRGVARIGGTDIALDPELGVVFSNPWRDND